MNVYIRFFGYYPITLSYPLCTLDNALISVPFLLAYVRLGDGADDDFFPPSFSTNHHISLSIHILPVGLHETASMLLLLLFLMNISIPVDESGLLMLYYSLRQLLFDTLFWWYLTLYHIGSCFSFFIVTYQLYHNMNDIFRRYQEEKPSANSRRQFPIRFKRYYLLSTFQLSAHQFAP